jgi:hypothetical protein
MDEEQQSRIGIALFVATLLALFAIVMADAFGFAFFDDVPLPIEEVSEHHAHIFAAMANCLNGGSISTKEVIVDCKRRK